MPKRTDIHSILLIGSGPIVIGQACEFDYSGTQACKALKEEGYRVILVNSNPATIMTDPEMADRTYIEPITVPIVEKIIERERPDALLPTIGGQTALNLAIELAEQGVLDRYGVELIGASVDAIKKAEDRDLFKEAMRRIGLDVPRSGCARSQIEEQLSREPKAFPTVKFNHDFKTLEEFKPEYIELAGYDPHPPIKAELTVAGGYNKKLHGTAA